MVQSSLRGKKEEMLKELEAVITGEHLMVTREYVLQASVLKA